jgi:hypothetical protein
MLKSGRDKEGLQQLDRLLRQSDVHVILARLLAVELAALQPLLRERKNFSILVDDWWSMPHWFLRSAEYVIFRNYNGIAVRLGKATLVDGRQPPVLLNPIASLAPYTVAATLLRLPALAVSPLVDLRNHFRRCTEPVLPGRYLYFPFPINEADVPLKDERVEYDFANTGGTCGIWLMRDPFVSFRHTFANLYYDRQCLTDAMGKFKDQPFKFYDCRTEKRFLPYEEYAQKNRQSRFLVATGGLHNVSVPKFLEYACTGTPMIGRNLPFEYPWLDECLFPLDARGLSPQQIKPLLQQALDRHPTLRQNCLNWRDQLLKNYNLHTLLDMLQEQIDGKPIRPGYLKPQAV